VCYFVPVDLHRWVSNGLLVWEGGRCGAVGVARGNKWGSGEGRKRGGWGLSEVAQIWGIGRTGGEGKEAG
jgi:hypothetical protein